jgi:hypothetical protein
MARPSHQVKLIGPLIVRSGTFSVRRGESDREAVRLMRRCVQEEALGLFVEEPGALRRAGRRSARRGDGRAQERVPIVPAAIHGSQFWKLGNFEPVSVAWGRPLLFDGLPATGKGYREASVEISARSTASGASWSTCTRWGAAPRHAATRERPMK